MTGDNEHRRAEKLRRERAIAHKGVVTGSGRALEPRKLKQMISVRLDPSLVGQLRAVANARNESLSETLREAAEMLVEQAMRVSQINWSVKTGWASLDESGTTRWDTASHSVAISREASG